MPISKIKENSLASGAITEANVGADIINAQTELAETANDADYILVYDTSAGVLKKVLKSNFTLQVPTVSSVSPTNLTSGDGTGNYTFTITGTNLTGGSAKLVNTSGSEISFDTLTVDSSTQITGVVAKSSVPGSGEPYDVKVISSEGLSATLTNQINIDQQPVFSTASGSLATVADGSRSGLSYTIAAADPESGGDVTYTLESGSLPAGLSGTSTSSGYVISGDATGVGSDTTSTFTIRAADVNSNTSDREFSITIQAPRFQVFTSSGTFSVPSGITTVDVLVVAGGGGGGSGHQNGYGAGGGGAGGLIFRPAFPVTPGGTVSVTVGCGGAGRSGVTSGQPIPASFGTVGQDSVFDTLTAKGGGGGGGFPGCNGQNGPSTGTSGGSGGGGGGANPANSCGSPGTQPTQPGDSGTYGFGNAGGGKNPSYSNAGGGGGGAGAVGGPVPGTGNGGTGGVGKSYTIADGTTPVYYAGGGGGSGQGATGGPHGQGGNGGGATGSLHFNIPGNRATGTATANRGGGGGGASSGQASAPADYDGSPGGKGIVIVRWS